MKEFFLRNKIILAIANFIILVSGAKIYESEIKKDTLEYTQVEEETEIKEETEVDDEFSIDEETQDESQIENESNDNEGKDESDESKPVDEDNEDMEIPNDTVVSEPEPQPVRPPNTTNEPVINHIVNKDAISYHTHTYPQDEIYTHPQTKLYLNKFKNNDNHFDSNEFGDYGMGLNELWFGYLGFTKNFTRIYDSQYKTYKLADDDFQRAIVRLSEVEAEIKNYKNFIIDALNDMTLCTTDKDLVNQISKFIRQNFSFERVRNQSVYSFVKTRQGTCHHYASLFNDMCNAVGINCEYLYCQNIKSTASHAINRVTINGQTYYFDLSSNDVSNTNKYSWMSEKEIRKLCTW